MMRFVVKFKFLSYQMWIITDREVMSHWGITLISICKIYLSLVLILISFLSFFSNKCLFFTFLSATIPLASKFTTFRRLFTSWNEKNIHNQRLDFYITTLLSFYGKWMHGILFFIYFFESDTIWRCFPYHGTNEIEFQVVTYDHLFESLRILVLWCVHGVGKWTWEKRKKKGKNNKFKFCEWMQWLLRHSVFNFCVIVVVSIIWFL